MAKARKALGLWRGSTKSQTYSVLDGMQIIKDRPDQIFNPQTARQMAVRVSFATVAKAGAVLHDLIGISFQGYRKVSKSKRRFNALNISKLANQIKNNVADGVFAPKNWSVLVPNKYIVADGSLRNASLGVISVNGQSDGFTQTTNTFKLELNKTYTPQELISLIYGCEPGDQITVVGIRPGVPVEYKESYLQILRDGEMVAARAIFHDDATLAGVAQFTSPSSLEAVVDELQDYLPGLFKEGYEPLISLIAENGFTAAAGEGNECNCTWDVDTASGNTYQAFDGIFGDTDLVAAVGYFRSHYRSQSDLWMFSRCELVQIDPLYDQNTYENEAQINYGYSFQVALPSYIKARRTRESDRFTEAGGSEDTLGF